MPWQCQHCVKKTRPCNQIHIDDENKIEITLVQLGHYPQGRASTQIQMLYRLATNKHLRPKLWNPMFNRGLMFVYAAKEHSYPSALASVSKPRYQHCVNSIWYHKPNISSAFQYVSEKANFKMTRPPDISLCTTSINKFCSSHCGFKGSTDNAYVKIRVILSFIIRYKYYYQTPHNYWSRVKQRSTNILKWRKWWWQT